MIFLFIENDELLRDPGAVVRMRPRRDESSAFAPQLLSLGRLPPKSTRRVD
jgi:hypothetical protein